jgi:hypothetical protein
MAAAQEHNHVPSFALFLDLIIRICAQANASPSS